MSELLNLPKGHVILESSTAELPLQKARFRIHKIYDSRKDQEYQLSFDAQQKKIDFLAALKKEQALYTKKYGKLHPVLHNTVTAKNRPRKIEVMVWLKSSTREPLKTDFSESELAADEPPKQITEARQKILSTTKNAAAQIAKSLGIKILRQSKIAPTFLAEVTLEQLNSVANLDEVTAVMLHEPEGIDDLQTSLDVSQGQQVVYVDDNRGRNIKVGVWEGGPDDETDLVISGRYDSSPTTRSHARLTSGIIKNREKDKPHGYAPSCKLYSANDKDTDALEWAVLDKKCRVISQSFHRASEQADGSLSSDDILKDYLALHHPYPTIVQAAGNIVSSDGETSSEFVNHKGYNSIAVGSHNDDATAMATSTTWRNPSTENGDRELPEICANGTNVSAVGLTKGGTSFAAPAVAGSSAVLMEIDSRLKSWPEGVRAILMAGATVNVRGDNWRQDVVNDRDARDGVGALNLAESAEIARRKKNPSNTPSRRGCDVGKLESSDFKSNKYAKSVYKIKVPTAGPTHVKVALAWDSVVSDFFGAFRGSSLTVDLDLKIFKGSTLVAQSSSWDNSYEVAEYDAKPGDELTIKIKRYSGSDWTYYGVAWTVF